MQIGIHLPHVDRKAGPEAIRRAAVHAEDLGAADVWVSEHIIIAKGTAYPPSPIFDDPVLSLTWAAAGVQHGMMEPTVRELDDWLAAVEWIAPTGEGLGA
jgi:alkanesulfonate monooxygenase SsuD/methylene tetrahydromethanopterin reductase-like flavin-dependent oxidoreductase (luciferase family)